MFQVTHASGSDSKGWYKLPALSGVLLGLSYFPGPFLLLNLAAFVPLLVWLDARPAITPYERLRAGFVFGLCVHLTALHFMYSMLAQSWLAVLLYIGTAAALALRISLTVVLAGWLRTRLGAPWALLLPICWLPLEWAQTWGDLRLTAEHLAHTVSGYPFLVQFAAVVGPYGVGAFLLVTNGLVYEAFASRGKLAGRRALIALAGLFLVVLAYDGWAWTRPEPANGTLRVALIQPNIPLDVKHDKATASAQWMRLASLSREAAEQGADLIVWPESARPKPLYHWLEVPDTYRMSDVQGLAKRLEIPLIVGAEYARIRTREDHDLYNAAFAVTAEGELLPEWAAKVNLVPFVEATPYRSLLRPLIEGKGGEWRWLSGGFMPGPRNVVMDVAGARVGVLVCYEGLFPDLARGLRNAGADLQVVITNDAWFGRSLFQPYQANAVRLRAIENRTAFVRVANTGISGFVDSRGRYEKMTGLFEEAVEVFDVKLAGGRTVYDRIGDVVAWVAVVSLLAGVVLARIDPSG